MPTWHKHSLPIVSFDKVFYSGFTRCYCYILLLLDQNVITQVPTAGGGLANLLALKSGT